MCACVCVGVCQCCRVCGIRVHYWDQYLRVREENNYCWTLQVAHVGREYGFAKCNTCHNEKVHKERAGLKKE